MMPANVNLFKGLAVAAVILGGVWLYLRYFEWRNLYYPSKEIDPLPSETGLEYEDVYFIAEDGAQLHGWWFPHKEARGVVIVYHGNAGNISSRIWMASDLNRLRLNVFMFDYRGYGLSKGVSYEKGLYRDARAAYEVVRNRYSNMDCPPVLFYGRSLGGAIATQLALEKYCKGLILESTFSSVHDMARKLYPALPAFLINTKYETLKKLPEIHVPLIIAHSRADDLIPFEMGRRLFEAANEPKQFCELQDGHNESGWSWGGPYWAEITKFVEKLFPVPDKN